MKREGGWDCFSYSGDGELVFTDITMNSEVYSVYFWMQTYRNELRNYLL